MEKITHARQNDVSNLLRGLESNKMNDDHSYDLDVKKPGIEKVQNNYVCTTKYIPFLDEHLLSTMHLVKCDLDRIQTTVPNFIGSPLP